MKKNDGELPVDAASSSARCQGIVCATLESGVMLMGRSSAATPKQGHVLLHQSHTRS